jgi:hypothetical protein
LRERERARQGTEKKETDTREKEATRAISNKDAESERGS